MTPLMAGIVWMAAQAAQEKTPPLPPGSGVVQTAHGFGLHYVAPDGPAYGWSASNGPLEILRFDGRTTTWGKYLTDLTGRDAAFIPEERGIGLVAWGNDGIYYQVFAPDGTKGNVETIKEKPLNGEERPVLARRKDGTLCAFWTDGGGEPQLVMRVRKEGAWGSRRRIPLEGSTYPRLQSVIVTEGRTFVMTFGEKFFPDRQRGMAGGAWVVELADDGGSKAAFIEGDSRSRMTLFGASGPSAWVVYTPVEQNQMNDVLAVRVEGGEVSEPVALWKKTEQAGRSIVAMKLEIGPDGRLWWIALADALGTRRYGDFRGCPVFVSKLEADGKAWSKPKMLPGAVPLEAGAVAQPAPLDGGGFARATFFVTNKELVIVGHGEDVPPDGLKETRIARLNLSLPLVDSPPGNGTAKVIQKEGKVGLALPSDRKLYLTLRAAGRECGGFVSVSDARTLEKALEGKAFAEEKENREPNGFLLDDAGRLVMTLFIEDKDTAFSRADPPAGEHREMTIHVTHPARIKLDLPDLEVATHMRLWPPIQSKCGRPGQ